MKLFVALLVALSSLAQEVRAFSAGLAPQHILAHRAPSVGVVNAVRIATPRIASQPRQLRCASAPQMGLFGLGTPELAIIAAVGLLVLGPDQVKKMAKEVGKVSAELKQVPEEFNKGLAAGQDELDAKNKPELAAKPEDSPDASQKSDAA